MSRPLRVFVVAIVGVAAIVALAVFGLAGSGQAARAAPQLPGEHIGGPPATLSSVLASSHGRGTVVVFWASWCGPCEKEAPALQRFSLSPAGSGRIVGVDWSDARSGALAFISRYRWTFPNLRDGEGTVGERYGLTNLPTTFVIDGRGRVRSVLRGPQDVASLTAALASVDTT